MNENASDLLPEKIVTFLLGDREYSVALDVVQEIIPMIEIVPMPELADYVLGVINLRGITVPIIDLKAKMGLEVTEITIYTPIIVCRLEGALIGILADKLLEILTLNEPNVDRVNEASSKGSIIDSVISIGDRTIFFIRLENLDLEKIFTHI